MRKRDFFSRLKEREEAAYLELFDEYHKYLHAIATNYVIDADIASDIVQETFIHLFNSIDRLGEIQNLRNYLIISVRNRSISYLRHLNLEDAHKLLYSKELKTIDIENSDTEELNQYVRQMLNSLPESCKKICKLRFLDGYKIREISEQLSLSPNTIKVQIHRGVSKMRSEVLKNVKL